MSYQIHVGPSYGSHKQFNCCIPGCTTGDMEDPNTDVDLFPLPSHHNKYTAWVTRIKSIYPDWRPNPMSRICGLHFGERRPSKEPEHNDFCPTIFPIPVVQDKQPGAGSMVFIQPLPQEACNTCGCCNAKEVKIKELNSALIKCRELNRTLVSDTSKAKTDIQLLKERLRSFEGKAENAVKFCSTEHVLNVNINMLRKQLNQEQAKTLELEQKLANKLIEVGDIKKEIAKIRVKEQKELRYDQKFMNELENEKKHVAQYKTDIEKLKEQKKYLRTDVTALRDTVKLQLDKIKNLEKINVESSQENLRTARKRPRVKKEPESSSVNSLMERGIKFEKLGATVTKKKGIPVQRKAPKRASRKIVRFAGSDEDSNTDFDEGTLSQIVMSKISSSTVKVEESGDESVVEDAASGASVADSPVKGDPESRSDDSDSTESCLNLFSEV